MDENQVEVTVEVTEPANPEPQPEDNPNQPQSVEILVGQLTAQVEQLQTELAEVRNLEERIRGLAESIDQIQRWNREELESLATEVFNQMSQMRNDVEELSENAIENTSEESENLSEIPAIPEQIQQEEPEEVQVSNRKRPWFL